MNKLLNIAEVSKKINLIDRITKKPLNHVLRYWEKQFKQIKPTKINNRRYYSQKQVETIKLINFLIKTKGMTILGVKNVLNSNINKLDDYNSDSLKADYYKISLKDKTNKLLIKLKRLKKYGKKNSFKSKNGSRK
jgi:DNA-binding transcriptional MerR regulator